MKTFVVKYVPHYAILAGNLAWVLCYRLSKDFIGKLLRIRFWELDMKYFKGIDFSEKNNILFRPFVLKSKTLHTISKA